MVCHNPRIITDGLILYLDAANTKSYPGTGTAWYDLSGNSYNGTLVDGPTFSTTAKGCFIFTAGSTQVVNCPAIAQGAAGSMGAWVYPTASVANSYAMVSVGASSNRFYLQYDGTNLYAVRGNPSGTAAIKTSAGLNLWHSITMTWENENIYSYYNGVYVSTNTFTNSSDTSGTFQIGKQSSNATFPGYIANCSIYTKRLSAAEVLQNYNALKSRYI